jgi:hypothetical protein
MSAAENRIGYVIAEPDNGKPAETGNWREQWKPKR